MPSRTRHSPAPACAPPSDSAPREQSTRANASPPCGDKGTVMTLTHPRAILPGSPPSVCAGQNRAAIRGSRAGPPVQNSPPRPERSVRAHVVRGSQVTRSVEVADEKVAQFLRVAERGAVTAGDLVGDGAQALLCQPPHEGGGEEVVVLADDEFGGHVRPGIERPGRVPHCR